jgi:hypothetical protein
MDGASLAAYKEMQRVITLVFGYKKALFKDTTKT